MSALAAGVCSVTFRDASPEEVVALAAEADLECVEWGGDVHVPHGDLAAAGRAAALTLEAGMSVCSYGSYLFADDGATAALADVLATAEALGAPAVRVWAPFGVEPGCDEDRFGAVVRALAEISRAAAERGLLVYLEFHGGTLTTTAVSATELLERVGADNLLCAWQPPYWCPVPPETEVADLARLAPHLAHLHVYSWLPDGTREPLAADEQQWVTRLSAASAVPGITGLRRAALLEFVAGDSEEAFLNDAERLRTWLRAIDPQPW